MNSDRTEIVQDIKHFLNLAINEHLNTQISRAANGFSYLMDKFEKSLDQENTNYSEIVMDDINFKIETDDFSGNINCWPIDGAGTLSDNIGYQDDHIHQIDSYYSEFPAVQPDHISARTNLQDLSSEQLYDDSIKLNPSDMLLQESSNSTQHLMCKTPAISIQTKPLLHGINQDISSSSTSATPSPTPSNFSINSQSNSTPSSLLYANKPSTSTSAKSSNYTTNAHTNSDSFHPNMWYPNTPYISYRTYGSTYDTQASHNQMKDVFQLSNSSREARNRAEKNRRDKLNGSIQQLSTMVPHAAESNKRLDKTAVLRLAAHGLRIHYVFGRSPNKSGSMQTIDALMKFLDSFLIAVTCTGQIVLVSSSIEQILGHIQNDIYGQNIINFIHPDDREIMKDKLLPADLDNIFGMKSEDDKGEVRQRTQAEIDEIDRKLLNEKRSFVVRMARSGLKTEPTVYELLKIDGCFRRSDMAETGPRTNMFPLSTQLTRRNRYRDEIIPLHANSNDVVLIAIASRVPPPIRHQLIEANRMEYRTRHLIDGRIVDCDQRISLVAGYMTDEVLNLSPFTFIHQDDVRWVIVALREMYDCKSSYGESTYRLFTRNSKIIYLHTKGFLEIDKSTNKVHSFVCVNTELSEEEGKTRIENMKKKFSVIINTQIPQSSNDLPAAENPQQLEKAVLCLIQNLKSTSSTTGNSDALTSSSLFSTNSPQRSTKTPPIALIPPAADSIKNSITKSVNVVKTTAAKFLYSTDEIVHDNNCPPVCSCNQTSGVTDDVAMSSSLNTEGGRYSTNSEQDMSRYCTSSVAAKRKLHYTDSQADTEDYIIPTQRRAIENVLSNSLQQINNRLNEQLNTAKELRDQGQRYELPHTEERIADIMKEHQKQQEMYKNISNEFEVQRKHSESSFSDDQIK